MALTRVKVQPDVQHSHGRRADDDPAECGWRSCRWRKDGVKEARSVRQCSKIAYMYIKIFHRKAFSFHKQVSIT